MRWCDAQTTKPPLGQEVLVVTEYTGIAGRYELAVRRYELAKYTIKRGNKTEFKTPRWIHNDGALIFDEFVKYWAELPEMPPEVKRDYA